MKTPERFGKKHNWLIRPGIASDLTPKDGTVQEWITSAEETIIRIGVREGRIKELSTSTNRRGISFLLFI